MTIRDQILSIDDAHSETMIVPEWGCTIRLRSMTARSRDLFERATEKDRLDALIGLLAATICDESGCLVFTANDIEALKDKNSAVLLRVFEAAMRVNAITPKDVEDLEGNS